MSSEQSLDPQLIEQTKQQIRMLVGEISQLAKSEIAPEEFYGEFLPRVVSALAAVGGAVWVMEDQGRLALGYQINLQQTRLRESEDDQIRHGRLLQKVLASGEGAVVPPHSGAAGDDQGGNPTEFLLVLAPLKAAEETVGVVEVFQRPNTRPATQKGYLRFLMEMCDRAGEFFKTHQLRHFTDRQVLWTQLEDFARGVHASLDPRDTAYTIANDGRRLIECDRVSVAIRKGRRCHVEAVSGQDLFDKRSNTVRLLGKLATVVVASEEPVWYTGDTSNLPPQVEDAMQEYVDESHSKTVAVLPLRRPQPVGEEEEDPDKRLEPEPPIGALIVEQIEDVRVPQKMVQRVEVVCEHSSIALANSLEHNNLFLMPLWRTLGKVRWVVKGRTLPKTVAVVILIFALLAAMVGLPWGFKMQANGSLEPVEQREVFAEIDGVVEEVLVKHADTVENGQLLVRLQNTDLEIMIKKHLSELAAIRDRIASLVTDRSAASGQRDIRQQLRLDGELQEAQTRKKSLLAQQALYE
ncbi:MAG TPA: biotin/lipoyl-binding protein, partial [Thermoguttaceae bacterium]|nr:biotin/lipoyl-binding protein [Thermoguttaceae bacterium]